jgi:hypothetical protein
MHYEQVIGVANEDRPLSPILNQFADRFLHPMESDIGQQARNYSPYTKETFDPMAEYGAP